jgi:putative N6-adenine-specific DNA methylase
MNRAYFAITAPGLEQICAAELRALDTDARAIDGGAGWTGDATSLYRANLELRTASRVVARVGEFRARGFSELERHTARLPWDPFIAAGTAITVRVTSRKSKLYHEGAIAERIAHVLGEKYGSNIVEKSGDDDGDDTDAGAQLIIVRVVRDDVTISVDASGVLLHQRGYRRAIGMAPLRETLAAAMLHAADWNPTTPLLDPFCGSGTIPIEAALIARRVAPGLANEQRSPRAYAFQAWPEFDAAAWRDVVTHASSLERPAAPAPIIGSDRHGGAITAALSNAERAGVAADIEFLRSPVESLTPPAAPGALVTNPPYGVRIGERRPLLAMYRMLGDIARERLGGWSLHMLVAENRYAVATALPLEERFATRNGGIPVRLLGTRIA